MRYKQYIKNDRFEGDFVLLETFKTELNELIFSSKILYYENRRKKLNHPSSQAKTYLSILNTFYNKKKKKKSFFVFVLFDSKINANIFNNVFAAQCAPLKNNSILPTNQVSLTELKICRIDFNEDEILKIIRDLNKYRAHGHDDISIRMVKICDKLLLQPLILLFHNSI